MKISLVLICVLVSGPGWASQTLHFFPYGGVDRYGYVYWPSDADQVPYEMARSGRKSEAFSYCLKRIDTASTVQDRFFYAVQASTLGYGLKKSHLVALKMDEIARRKIGSVASTLEGRDRLAKSDWLALAFARAAADDLARDSDNRYADWAKQDVRDNPNVQRWGLHAAEIAKSLEYMNLEERYVKACWAWLSGHHAISRKLMKSAADEIDQPGPYLTLARYWVDGNSEPGNGGSIEAANHYVALVRKRWPNYSRGIFYDAYRLSHKGSALTKDDAVRGVNLLTIYLQSKGNPAYELADARKALERLRSHL